MEPLLDLPIDQFFGALDELGLDPERRADLLREYRRRNSAFSPVYGLLDSVADEDAAAGMQRADIVPISRPEGMSVFDAVRSGEAQLAVPQGALDAVRGVAGALDVPAAAAAGLIPREDMVGEALNAAGVVMGLGGLLARPAGSLGMGGRVAPRSGDETPAQQVARLLREGRAGEVTDDLMAQVDPQEMARLYETGATGMDMPMDFDNRRYRADEMGFDLGGQRPGRETYYHQTPADVQEFRLNAAPESHTQGGAVWLSETPRNIPAAHNTIDFLPDGPQFSEGVNILPVVTRGDARVPYDYVYAQKQADNLDINFPMVVSGDQNRMLRDAGYTHADMGIERAVFDPRNIRSRFARFDPRLSHLSNLNAANIDPLTGAAAMGASQQQQDPLASLRAYLAQNGLLSQ